jgi:hypothetical protein
MEPTAEIIPSRNSIFFICFKTNMMSIINGISVNNGAKETFIPCILPFLNVSEITRAINGPGDNPAVIPKDKPIAKYSETMNDKLQEFKILEKVFCYQYRMRPTSI